MTSPRNYIQHALKIVVAFLGLLSAVLSTQGQDNTPEATKIWTTIGSAGTLDKNDASRVALFNSVVQIGTIIATAASTTPTAQFSSVISSQTESAVIRYNVTPIDGLFNPFILDPTIRGRGTRLQLRYLAVGAQVVAKLIETDLASGEEVVWLTFDSERFPSVNGYHVEAVDGCPHFGRPANFDFDFNLKAYYIEATLTHHPIMVGSAAGIQIIKLIRCAPSPTRP